MRSGKCNSAIKSNLRTLRVGRNSVGASRTQTPVREDLCEILFRLNWIYMQSCLNLSSIKSAYELSRCVCVRSLSELAGDVSQLYVSCVGYSGVLFVYAGQVSNHIQWSEVSSTCLLLFDHTATAQFFRLITLPCLPDPSTFLPRRCPSCCSWSYR